jgi:chemotaxis protein methyltransferase CheR
MLPSHSPTFDAINQIDCVSLRNSTANVHASCTKFARTGDDVMDDQQFRQLLSYFGLSWRGYRKVRRGVKRRIRRHMRDLGCYNIIAYLEELDKDKEARLQCERLFTVSISRFFRDRKLWEALREQILPQLVEKHERKIRVWFAGCASGEEVYSLKILWAGLLSTTGNLPELEITATDINPAYIERGLIGAYPASSLKELPEELRSVHFVVKAAERLYFINTPLKQGIFWQVHNFLSAPPGYSFDVLFLRNNLLTYYQNDIKRSAFKKVIDSLSCDGILVIGSHEKLPLESSCLVPLPSLSYVFRKG